MATEQATIKTRLQTDLTASMKARDELTTSTMRMLRAAITNAEVAGAEAIELTDDQAIAVLQSEAKKRAEAAEIYEQAGRAESAAKERAELAVIERYLPAAMSDDRAAGDRRPRRWRPRPPPAPTGQRAMGQVIKAVRERVGAAADGSRIAAMVKAALWLRSRREDDRRATPPVTDGAVDHRLRCRISSKHVIAERHSERAAARATYAGCEFLVSGSFADAAHWPDASLRSVAMPARTLEPALLLASVITGRPLQ